MNKTGRIGLIVAAWIFGAAALFAQSFPTGAILDETLYDSLPQKAVQLSRSYTEIPRAVSLKRFAPYPGNQSPYGTCTAWASAYAARTIAESIALNRQDRFLTTANVFSPLFVYKSVFTLYKNNPNPQGDEGIAISAALDFLKKEGPVKMQDFEKTAALPQFFLSAFSNARRYPIGDYARLYASWRDLSRGGDPVRTRMVKKSIAEGKPVIIGIKCPGSFFDAEGDVWHPPENPDDIDVYQPNGAHALCVVGYDDGKYGGAFEIQNSWGTGWRNGGYVWIPYDVFDQFAYEAYELIENLAAYGEVSEYSGKVQIEVQDSADGMPVRFQNGYYQTVHEYPSGARFRYLLGNDKPAYIYAFASDDSTNKTTMIFPYEGQNISPVLDYSENLIPFPSEDTWIELDDITGTDYLVVLYAKEALDIDQALRRFESAGGSFPDRVAGAVGDAFIPYSEGRYETDAMQFSARSANNRAVFGLLLAIQHRQQ
jgi:hypothetical protein